MATNQTPQTKKFKSFLPTAEDMKLIKALEKKIGLGYSQIARLALRSLAKEQGLRS